MAENLVIKHGNKGQLPNNKEKGTIYFAKDPNNTSHGKIYYDTPEATSVRVDMSGCGYTDSGEGAEIFNNYSGTDKNKASGNYSHAEGYATEASGSYSHTSGLGTVAKGDSQTVIGRYNTLDNDNSYVFIIGSGTNNTSRSNALTVDWNGIAEFSGVVKSDGKELLTSSDASSTYLSKTDASNAY